VHNESSDRVKWHVPTALCCALALVAVSWWADPKFGNKYLLH
jgi:hypothetical protein